MTVDTPPPAMRVGVPDSLIAGDTWQWAAPPSCYSPVDGWILTYYLRGESQLDVVATANDSGGWTVTAAATDTEGISAGPYSWAARVSKGGEVYTIFSGTVVVKAGLSGIASPFDNRTSAEKQLTNVEGSIEALLTKRHASVSFGDQSYTLQDVEKLMNIRDRLRSEISTSRRGGGRRTHLITFRQP